VKGKTVDREGDHHALTPALWLPLQQWALAGLASSIPVEILASNFLENHRRAGLQLASPKFTDDNIAAL
jgi:hypothetical protein